MGDDLDAPVDPSAPMRWTHAGVTEGDPALPEGVEALAMHVEAPSELARQLAQIGVVAKERGADWYRNSRPGSGWCRRKATSGAGTDLSAAHAPTGAARRLAERARLVDIENENEQARVDASAKRQALETAEAELGPHHRPRVRHATHGAPPSARPTPRASATPLPSARSIATPRGIRR